MDPSQMIRALRQACTVAGLAPQSPEDDATHDEAIDLLDQLIEAVDRDRPTGRTRPAAEPAPEPRRGWGRTDPERIRALAEAGRTDPQIAAELGVSPASVRSTRRRAGIPAGVAGGGQPTGWEDRVREAHGRGLTVAEIAAEIDYTTGAVYQALFRLGLRANRAKREG